ncbi:MAG: hypothetical protein DSM106950_42730 [Stigonema ocellatum SAG 48.90 = DSM 106950]|nr:hypothetical protein [Stigonema ocellatum SAG 48.90 = DSM 106950]
MTHSQTQSGNALAQALPAFVTFQKLSILCSNTVQLLGNTAHIRLGLEVPG